MLLGSLMASPWFTPWVTENGIFECLLLAKACIKKFLIIFPQLRPNGIQRQTLTPKQLVVVVVVESLQALAKQISLFYLQEDSHSVPTNTCKVNEYIVIYCTRGWM